MISNNDGTYRMPSSSEQAQQRSDGTYSSNAVKNASNNASSNNASTNSQSSRPRSNNSSINSSHSPVSPVLNKYEPETDSGSSGFSGIGSMEGYSSREPDREDAIDTINYSSSSEDNVNTQQNRNTAYGGKLKDYTYLNSNRFLSRDLTESGNQIGVSQYGKSAGTAISIDADGDFVVTTVGDAARDLNYNPSLTQYGHTKVDSLDEAFILLDLINEEPINTFTRYNTAIAEGLTDEDAAAYANRSVRSPTDLEQSTTVEPVAPDEDTTDYTPYQYTKDGVKYQVSDEEIQEINLFKKLGYNDQEINNLLNQRFSFRTPTTVEEVDQGSMLNNMVGADDNTPIVAPQPVVTQPVEQLEPVVIPTPTYNVPYTPTISTEPMSSGTYQSPVVTQPQFVGNYVDPNTGTYQLQQGMGFAPSNIQFNVPQISTGVLGQGQAMGYNPTLQLVTPQPYVQSGYMPTFKYNEGGMVPNTMQQQQPASTMPMTQSTFGGFKPEAMQRIAGSLGYQGDMAGFDEYLNANPDKKQKMDMYNQKAMQMARGGIVQKFQEGGSPTLSYGAYGYNEGDAGYVPSDPRPLGQQYIPEQEFYPSTVEVPIYDDAGNQTGTRTETRGYSIQDAMATQALFPGLPTGATVVPVGVSQEAGQFIDPRSGQVYGSSALPTALATTTQAGMPQATPTTLMTAATGAEAVDEAVSGMQPAQGEITDQALVTGQEGVSSLNIDAAQGTATMMTNPVTREIQSGELISGAADAQKAAKFTEQIQAATAEPSQKATVQGQLEGLMQQFEGGDTPAWAAGAMRNAMGAMAARGLGASSLAGQAAVQAAMESALPIAQADAQTQAKFESQNLSNRQQRAMLAAQQRAQFIGQEFDQAFQSRVMNASKISDVANMNFTAEQQVALENSRAANSMNLANLSNRQASVMAEAAAIANMDMANLNNRQQAAVMNAQSFLQMDMANLSNKQQTELFQAQQRVQSLFNDQAAINAAAQFNASSQNQTDQFFANLASQTSQFNASQANAQSQFNAGQTNVIERFNTEINNQREQFNASNRLVIDQANATWRREIATMDTAAVNRANEINAEALLGVSRDAYNNLWQYYSDNMEWAWTSAENEKTRYVNMALAELNANAEMDIAEFKADYQSSIGFGNMIGKILTTDLTGSLGGTILGDVFDFLGG